MAGVVASCGYMQSDCTSTDSESVVTPPDALPHEANEARTRAVVCKHRAAIVVAQQKDRVVAIRALSSSKTGYSLLEYYPAEGQGSRY